MRVIGYKLVKVDVGREDKVRKLMQAGWQPLGAPIVYGTSIVQTMVCYKT